MARIVHQYRLTDSVKEYTMQIAGINLTKDWISYPNVAEKLVPFIKTDANKSGLVDYERKNYDSNEVLYKSVPNIDNMPIYTKAQLFIMSRVEICEICRDYAIITTNRSNAFLVKEILEKQSGVESTKEPEVEKEVIQDEVIQDEIKVEQDSTRKSLFDILKR